MFERAAGDTGGQLAGAIINSAWPGIHGASGERHEVLRSMAFQASLETQVLNRRDLGTQSKDNEVIDSLHKQTVNILGLGYVGFPCALLAAKAGHRVHGVDIDHRRLKILEKGEAPFPEVGLQDLFDEVRQKGALSVGLHPEPADVHIITVPTPITADKQPDLSFVQSACRSIVPFLRKGDLVLVESTVSPGAIHECVAPTLEQGGLRVGEEFSLAYCPERVLPGAALREMVHNDRVLGGIDERSCERARSFYQTFVEGKLHLASARQAVMVKLLENAYRDVNIAFANEVEALCRAEGLDSRPVIELANLHPRVNILQPGPGVGGHCIPVDPWFLVARSENKAPLLQAARTVNDARPADVVTQAVELLFGLSDPSVAVLGVTYKPNVSDTRQSPSLEIVQMLRMKGLRVKACDPFAEIDGLYELDEAVTGSDLVLALVKHDIFTCDGRDPAWYESRMRRPRILDIGGFWPESRKNSSLTPVTA